VQPARLLSQKTSAYLFDLRGRKDKWNRSVSVSPLILQILPYSGARRFKHRFYTTGNAINGLLGRLLYVHAYFSDI
jgi:hypothetical protein